MTRGLPRRSAASAADHGAGSLGWWAGTAAAAALLVTLAACTPSPPAHSGAVSDDGRALFPDLAQFSGLDDTPMEGASSEFWEWWGDGQAELSGYRMVVGRYGAPREAELALIYVTEPHDRRTWIKDDHVEEPHRVNVMKLNQNVAFLTGIYPYAVMTSVFAPVDRYRTEPFSPVRIVHSVQEWCGAYSHLVWPGPDRYRSLRLSYFAHEGERIREVEADGPLLYEDALLVQLRELDGPFAGGGDWEGMLVPELWRLRAGHRGTDPVPARITREEATRTVEGLGGAGRPEPGAGEGESGAGEGESGAGAGESGAEESGAEVPVTRFTLQAGDYERVFEVERDPPRRILGWSTSTGEEAELLATERLAYWELNRPGDESWRETLGLSPRGVLPPGAGDAPAGGCPQ